MKTRIEAFIERLAESDDDLGSLSRKLSAMGQTELAREVYALYVEAFIIHRELEHQRNEKLDNKLSGRTSTERRPGPNA